MFYLVSLSCVVFFFQLEGSNGTFNYMTLYTLATCLPQLSISAFVDSLDYLGSAFNSQPYEDSLSTQIVNLKVRRIPDRLYRMV